LGVFQPGTLNPEPLNLGKKRTIDMAAKRHKKHKIKISGLVISVGYNE